MMGLYSKATGKNPSSLDIYKGDAKPETVNLIPAGIPVLLAVLFFMLLAVIFISVV